ncbi:hypothetical protein FB451DRAFT_1033478 [Mycena latifolia]|nr:hypothetical protein FB451DRAFT_1033478 [Mycena latifolia]
MALPSLRKCECSCPVQCRCRCSCLDHCSCLKDCNGNCYETLPTTRNLVVSIDGTSNQFGAYNTHVVELHSHVRKEDPARKQLTFYVSGIGTYTSPTVRKVISNTLDMAFARNFERQVQDAYRWLADNYQPGDRIFLFGFSRGAYQVRALAGMIEKMGLILPGNFSMIPFAYELYTQRLKGKISKDADDLCPHFKKTFSRKIGPVHFVGAWDTVASVGIIRGQPLPLTTSADHICHFRHALALDEHRVRFMPEYINGSCSQTCEPPQPSKNRGDIKEVWFAGTHSDIGGGNRVNKELTLGRVPLLWMENEASSAGLCLEPQRGGGVWHWHQLKDEAPTESLTGGWRFLEILPFTRSTYNPEKPEQTKR